MALFAAFAIAFLAALNIDYMVDLMIVRVARMFGQPSVAPPPSDLTTVIQNQDAIDVLKTISVFSIGEFINIDPMRLYLNLPQSIGAIDGVDEDGAAALQFPQPTGRVYGGGSAQVQPASEPLCRDHRASRRSIPARGDPMV